MGYFDDLIPNNQNSGSFEDSSSAQQSSGGLFDDLIPQQSQQDPSKFDQLANVAYETSVNGSILARDFILGAGDELTNLVRSGANFLAPESLQTPYAKWGEGSAYGTGKLAGSAAAYIGGAGLGRAGLKAIQSSPQLAKLLQSLTSNGAKASIGRQAAGGAAFGSLENHENRGAGAALGGVLGGAFGALPELFPKKSLPELYHGVSNLLQKSVAHSNQLYNSVLSKFGNQPIILKGVEENIFKKNSKLKEQYSKFKENPSIQNAHELQSQLGSESRRIKDDDVTNINYIEKYNAAREKILYQIEKTLGSKHPAAAERYKAAREFHRSNVIPTDMTYNQLKNIVHPKPTTVSQQLEAVTKKYLYPKNWENGEYIPQIPSQIGALQEQLNRRIRNKNLLQATPNIPLFGHADKIFGGLSLPLTGNLAAKYNPDQNPIYKALIQAIGQKLPGVNQ